MNAPRPLLPALGALAALLLCAGALGAQDVSPLNRILVIDAGKTGTIKIKDVDGCKPTWTAASANESVAAVKPDTAKSSKGRSFKVKAGSGFPAMTTVTVTLMGTGAGCEETVELDFQVVVVRKEKAAEKMTKQAGKQEAKAFKKFQKSEEKSLDQDLDAILDQLADDLAAVDAGEGGSALEQKQALLRLALIAGLTSYTQFFTTLLLGYAQFGQNIQFAAQQAVFNYAYLPLLAATLLLGGGGVWDLAVAKMLQTATASAVKATLLFRKFVTALTVLAALNGVPLGTGFLEYVQALCYPDLCGPSVAPLDSATLPTDSAGLKAWTAAQQQALHARVAAADAGEGGLASAVVKLQLLCLVPWTQFTGGVAQGRIFGGGVAPPDDGEVFVVVQRAGSVDVFPAEVEFDEFGAYYFVAGGDDEDALEPGKYDVRVTQGGSTVARVLDLQAR